MLPDGKGVVSTMSRQSRFVEPFSTRIGTTKDHSRGAPRAGMCLCFPPWFCAACCGWRGVNTIGPPRDADAIARRRERRESRGRCCWSAAPRHPRIEGRAGGEVEMTPGERAGAAEASTSVAEANAPPSVAAKLTVLVPAASDRTPGSGSGDASVPETPLAGSGRSREEEEEEEADDARAMAGFRSLPLVARDPRDPRDPNSPRKYGLGKPRRPKRGASASAATRATSTESVAVVVAG